ncbi:MAG: hypothetical protein RL588_1865 [Pseudomonadota bacterium]
MAGRPHIRVFAALLVSGAAVLGPAGLAPAQQAPAPPGPASSSDPGPEAVGPVAPVIEEEAPPAVVEAPPPAVTPPVPASQVAPAEPPERQVAERPVESVKKRERFDVAVLQAVDKVTAETIRFEAPVGQPVRYKSLILTVRACERTAADEPAEDSIAYLTVDSQPKVQAGRPAPDGRQVFRGWIYASSPGLNGPEHPVYDAWLITCRTSAPLRTAAGAPMTPSTSSAPASRSR